MAVVPECHEADIYFYHNLAEVKQQVVLLVPDIRIPIYGDYELNGVRQVLNNAAAARTE